MTDQTDYRVAFILPITHQLLGMPSGNGARFPQISISLRERQAEDLTRVIQDKWNIATLVLDFLWDGSFESQCAVVEVRSASWQFTRDGFTAVPVEMIESSSLGETERATLRSILAGDDTKAGPFTRIGWIDEAQAWIQRAVYDREVHFSGELRHLNAGGAFCLVCLATDSGPAYWFKAVGVPNLHEFDITAYLATHCSEYLPRVAATRSDWNAWVMEEYGYSLHESTSLNDFERAAIKLARLQKHLVGKTDELLAVRCGDHRIESLAIHVDEIIAYLGEAMSRQTSTKAPKLTQTRLEEVGNLLHKSMVQMQRLNIPDSLMHNDISPGSILSNGSDCVFTDWCEAYVGNPFITLEQLCMHAQRKTNEPEVLVSRLKNVYRSCWIGLLTEHQIDTTLKLTPLLSVFSYLYGRGEWLHSSRRNDAGFQSYARSLARHMDRIAQSPDLMGAL